MCECRVGTIADERQTPRLLGVFPYNRSVRPYVNELENLVQVMLGSSVVYRKFHHHYCCAWMGTWEEQ